MLLSGLLSFIFLNKENIFLNIKYTQNEYFSYLTQQWKLIEFLKLNENAQCNNLQQASVIKQDKLFQYSFHCVKKSIFIQPYPTKEKYIPVNNIRNWLDVDYYSAEIIPISSLNEFPISSEDNPKIVRALNDIDEQLTRDFYGVVITDHLFDIKGRYKIYGTIYSTYDNQREERNLTYKRKVIENLDKQFSRWEYLSNSRNMLANEDSESGK